MSHSVISSRSDQGFGRPCPCKGTNSVDTHMKVYEGMAYGLSQVWVKTEVTVQRNSIEENKNKWQNIW